MAQDVPGPKNTGPKGGLPITNRAGWFVIYGFFLVHMLGFGTAGFIMSYSGDVEPFENFLFSGFAIFVYMIFYLVIFGIDEIGWLFMNSALGILGIFSQLDWLLEFFGRDFYDYPMAAHIVPTIYYILYTFLLRRAILHIFRVEYGTRKKLIVDGLYVGGSLSFYLFSLFV